MVEFVHLCSIHIVYYPVHEHDAFIYLSFRAHYVCMVYVHVIPDLTSCVYFVSSSLYLYMVHNHAPHEPNTKIDEDLLG